MRSQVLSLFARVAVPFLCVMTVACGDKSAPATQGAAQAPAATSPKPSAPSLTRVIEHLRAAHGELAKLEVKSPELDPTMDRVLRSQLTYRTILRGFFEKVGQGTLVSAGRPTAAARAVLAYAKTVATHGIDDKPYKVDKAEQELKALEKQAATEGKTQRMELMDKLLLAATFDARGAEKSLGSLQPPLQLEEIDLAKKGLVRARKEHKVTEKEAEAEVTVARVLLRLVCDFRVFRRAGPFRPLTNKEEPFAHWGPRPKVIAQWMSSVATASDPAAAVQWLAPREPGYKALLKARADYLGYAKERCHARLYTGWQLRMGNSGEEVSAVQSRLACEGLYKGPIDGQFSKAVKDAVSTYQKHHDIEETGSVDKDTLTSMNVPFERRAEQISLTMLRMREADADQLGSNYIRVNLPAFRLDYVRDHKVMRSHKVIVGTNRLDDNKLRLVQGHINRTKLFKTQLYEVVANPDWILPDRVAKGELVAKMAADRSYMKRHNIRRITLPSGKSVLVQGRGEGNVLGRVKFLLRESSAIFLHDTDDRSLFRHRRRDLSHGCVRVQGALKFATWLLVQDGWHEREVKRSFKADTTQRGMRLKQPVPLITQYYTVAVSDEDRPVFYTDIYGYDRAYFKEQLPAQVEARWGDVHLRPSWVPEVPEAKVLSWKKAGKAAPRNLKVKPKRK